MKRFSGRQHKKIPHLHTSRIWHKFVGNCIMGLMVTQRSGKLSPRDNRIVKRLKLRLQEITPINRVVVFGSRARGDASPDSDLDVFIEIPELNAALRRKISEIAWEVSLDEEILISTFVVTTAAILDSPFGANPILRTITTEGITV